VLVIDDRLLAGRGALLGRCSLALPRPSLLGTQLRAFSGRGWLAQAALVPSTACFLVRLWSAVLLPTGASAATAATMTPPTRPPAPPATAASASVPGRSGGGRSQAAAASPTAPATPS